MDCKKIMRGLLGVTAAAMLFCGCGRKGKIVQEHCMII